MKDKSETKRQIRNFRERQNRKSTRKKELKERENVATKKDNQMQDMMRMKNHSLYHTCEAKERRRERYWRGPQSLNESHLSGCLRK
jgi:hypothetical protein